MFKSSLLKPIRNFSFLSFALVGALATSTLNAAPSTQPTTPSTAPSTAPSLVSTRPSPSTSPSTQASTAPSTQAARADVSLLNFNTQESLERLVRSHFKASYLALANNFKPQENKFFCGPTTGVILLNSLRAAPASDLKRPVDLSKYDPQNPKETEKYLPVANGNKVVPVFERYTENTFFTAKTDRVKTKDEVYGLPHTEKDGRVGKSDPGLSLVQFTAMLTKHNLDAHAHHVDDNLAPATIMDDFKHSLETPGTFAVVNYYRPALGQKGGGHISPLGAYDVESDSFLIMDVNPSAQPWVWVKSADLIAAMHTRQDDGQFRGYAIVKEGNPERKVQGK